MTSERTTSLKRRPPATTVTDLPELLRRAQRGDVDSLTDLVGQCRPLIASVARVHLSSPVDVDDVVQEVSLKLMLNAAHIRNPEAVSGWIRRVATNAAMTHHRRAGRVVVCETFDDIESGESTEDTALAGVRRDTVSSAVQDSLSRLRPAEASLVRLLFGTEAPDYRSISQQTGRPVGSIGPTRQRLLDRLRRDSAVALLGA
jgi:RNA polymerase sigma factor (sigma-70 family)